jgi:hypothetical protein
MTIQIVLNCKTQMVLEVNIMVACFTMARMAECIPVLGFKADRVAAFNMLLIEWRLGTNIARRLGLGQIFLKKRTKTNPKFKALIPG